MKVIGVVGGMGSGKSTVVDLITELENAYVINADHIGHEMLKKGNAGYIPVVDAFGTQILGKDGEINRQILGGIVFSDSKQLQKLNKISHPLIYKTVKDEIEFVKNKDTYESIIVDAALLIEIKLIELVDEVWGVHLPKEVQVKRVMHRNNLSEEEARKRISTQLPWEEIQKITDIEIDNSHTIDHAKEQISYLLKQNLEGIVKGE